MSSINSSGAARGSVSAQNAAYLAAVKKDQATAAATAAAQKAAAAAKAKSEKAASLKKSVSFLETQNIGYTQEYSKAQTMSAYAQEVLISNKWGSNQQYNAQIFNGSSLGTQSDTTNSIVGATLTSTDQLRVQAYVTAQAKIVSSSIAAFNQNTNLINADNAIIYGKPAPKPTGSNAGGGKGPGKGNVPGAKPKPSATAQTPAITAPPEFPDSDYQWNLPPHQWSLPVDPYDLAPNVLNKRTDDIHSSRRGRIWYYIGYVGPNYEATSDTISTTGGAAIPSTNQPPGSTNKYGFQFVWNPETYNQSTSVNMQITPSNTDPTIALTGFAAANSQISFTLRIDRTNDFTCAAGYVNPYINTSDPTLPQQLGAGVALNLPATEADVVNYDYNVAVEAQANLTDQFVSFYTQGQAPNSAASLQAIQDNIVNLLTYGTEADLEYLYKVVNGSGWKGIGGRPTSNIGYLMPSLIRLDLGQQKFVGVVSSVNVSHLAFTRDMVPIRTDVEVTVDLRANIQATTNNGTTP